VKLEKDILSTVDNSMLVLKAEKEVDVYRILLNAMRNIHMPATLIYVGRAKPKGVIVHGIREKLLPQIPGYLVYRTGKIEYPGIITGIITRGYTRQEALERMAVAIEGYKVSVIKEEL